MGFMDVYGITSCGTSSRWFSNHQAEENQMGSTDKCYDAMDSLSLSPSLPPSPSDEVCILKRGIRAIYGYLWCFLCLSFPRATSSLGGCSTSNLPAHCYLLGVSRHGWDEWFPGFSRTGCASISLNGGIIGYCGAKTSILNINSYMTVYELMFGQGNMFWTPCIASYQWNIHLVHKKVRGAPSISFDPNPSSRKAAPEFTQGCGSLVFLRWLSRTALRSEEQKWEMRMG